MITKKFNRKEVVRVHSFDAIGESVIRVQSYQFSATEENKLLPLILFDPEYEEKMISAGNTYTGMVRCTVNSMPGYMFHEDKLTKIETSLE